MEGAEGLGARPEYRQCWRAAKSPECLEGFRASYQRNLRLSLGLAAPPDSRSLITDYLPLRTLNHFCYISQAAASNQIASRQNRKDPMQTASIRWTGEQKFLAVSPSGHAVPFDSDRESNKAPGAMEMVLMALGACTATDMVLILEKKRQKLESLEVLCSGERAAEPPTVWTKLEVRFRLRGTLDEAAVQHAMSLTEEKYCSVAAMLKKTAAFTWRYEILPPAAAQ